VPELYKVWSSERSFEPPRAVSSFCLLLPTPFAARESILALISLRSCEDKGGRHALSYVTIITFGVPPLCGIETSNMLYRILTFSAIAHAGEPKTFGPTRLHTLRARL
jgi:hypothetical protein